MRGSDGRDETEQTFSMFPQNFLQPLRQPYRLVLQPSEQKDADGFLPFPKDKFAKILNIASDKKTPLLKGEPQKEFVRGGVREKFPRPKGLVT